MIDHQAAAYYADKYREYCCHLDRRIGFHQILFIFQFRDNAILRRRIDRRSHADDEV